MQCRRTAAVAELYASQLSNMPLRSVAAPERPTPRRASLIRRFVLAFTLLIAGLAQAYASAGCTAINAGAMNVRLYSEAGDCIETDPNDTARCVNWNLSLIHI